MRVHGAVVINRRTKYDKKKDYSEYREILIEDFQDICGYCGKNRKHFFDNFEIDHFRPKKKYPLYKNTYENLVLACSKCNGHKSEDWPTNDPAIFNDGMVGYVDPASEEFDNNIERNAKGQIVGITDVGKYMISKLKLDIRQTDVLWKLDNLHSQMDKLEDIIKSKKDTEASEELNRMNIEIRKLTEYLKYECRE